MEQKQSSVIVLESEDGNKGTLHQKRVRQRRKSLTDTHMTLRSLPETLQTTALPSLSRLQHLAPIHATRGYNGYLLAYFRIFFCARHTLRMRIPSYYMPGTTTKLSTPFQLLVLWLHLKYSS